MRKRRKGQKCRKKNRIKLLKTPQKQKQKKQQKPTKQKKPRPMPKKVPQTKTQHSKLTCLYEHKLGRTLFIYIYIYIWIYKGDPRLCTATSRIQRKFFLPQLGARRRSCLSGLGFCMAARQQVHGQHRRLSREQKGWGEVRHHRCSSNPTGGESFWGGFPSFRSSWRLSPARHVGCTCGQRTVGCQPSPGRNRDAMHPTRDATCAPGDSPAGRRCTYRWQVPALFASGGDGGDAGDFGGVVRPRLEVLEGKERGVVDTDGVGLDGLVDGFLEGLLLQLHEDAVRLLPLGLPLLRRLPPRRERAVRGAWGSKGGLSPERIGYAECLGLEGGRKRGRLATAWSYIPCTNCQ